MRKISIAKALKEKNRITKMMNDCYQHVTGYNVVRATVYPEKDGSFGDLSTLAIKNSFDVKNEFGKWVLLRDRLVDLKTKISLANAGIAHELVQMSELKSAISQLNGIRSMAERDISYEADRKYANINDSVIHFGDLQDMIQKTQKAIEDLQDNIDDFNASHFIEVDWE